MGTKRTSAYPEANNNSTPEQVQALDRRVYEFSTYHYNINMKEKVCEKNQKTKNLSY